MARVRRQPVQASDERPEIRESGRAAQVCQLCSSTNDSGSDTRVSPNQSRTFPPGGIVTLGKFWLSVMLNSFRSWHQAN